MAHRPEPPASRNVTLQIGPSAPGDSHLDVRVAPDHAQELRDCLEAEGLQVSDAIEMSTGEWLQIFAVSIPAAIGARSVIAVAITKFLERHQGKKVTFGAQGQVESMENFSANDVVKVLDTVAQQQREVDQAWDAWRKKTADNGPEGDDKPGSA